MSTKRNQQGSDKPKEIAGAILQSANGKRLINFPTGELSLKR